MFLGLNSPLKVGIFVGYVCLWVSAHLLVYGSRLAGAPAYNPTSVVLLTELTKLTLSVGFYLSSDGSFSDLVETIKANGMLFVKYFVPALMYCLYNNLVYINLRTFDPGTYNVLMQLKIALTGVVYQIMFSRKLNRNQWAAIFLITFGCMLKESGKASSGDLSSTLQANLWGWMLLFGQGLCSVMAGVYTEVLLKGAEDVRVTTNLQNALMYIASMICNVGYMLVDGTLADAMSLSNASAILTPSVIGCIVIMSSVGLVTGFFLKHLDSVLKAIAGALEIVATMLLSMIVFGVAVNLTGFSSAVVVGMGVALYSRPVEPKKPEKLAPAEGTDLENIWDEPAAPAAPEPPAVIGHEEVTYEERNT